MRIEDLLFEDLDSYARNYSFGAKYMPLIKDLIGPRLITLASFEEDTRQATDLVIRTPRIACRVRKSKYFWISDYKYEFTIRVQVASGGRTELEKIMDGFCDVMVYGIARNDNDHAQGFQCWWALSLDSFRYHMRHNFEKIKSTYGDNSDGTRLQAFDLRTFPAEPKIIMFSSHTLDELATIGRPKKQQSALPLFDSI